MESRNPIIRRAEEQYVHEAEPAALQDLYDAPAVAGPGELAMTLEDVIMKAAFNFIVLLVGAVLGWNTASSLPYLWLGAALAGLVVGLVNAFRRDISPPLVMIYAFVQGIFLGGISFFYQEFGEANGFGNLVLTAVVATLVVFAVMLALYSKQIIRVTGKFRKIMMVAMVSYLGFAMISIMAGLFGVGGGMGFFGVGPIGIIFSALVVCVAAFALCLDFEDIVSSIQYGVPERESWRMAFGLMVTLIWLYLEILRFFAVLAANRD